MITKQISTADTLALATRPEDHFFDRKASAVKGAKVQKIAVAFANADGGEFFVGVADDQDEADPGKRWKGAPTIEDFNQHIQALSDVQPALPMDLAFLRAEGQTSYVLRVQIEKSQSVHKTADGTVYERKGAQSLPVTDPVRITALAFAKGAASYEDYSVAFGTSELGTATELHAADVFHRKKNFKEWSDFGRRIDVLVQIARILSEKEVRLIDIQINCELLHESQIPEEIAFMFLCERANDFVAANRSLGMLIGDRENDHLAARLSTTLSVGVTSGTSSMPCTARTLISVGFSSSRTSTYGCFSF